MLVGQELADLLEMQLVLVKMWRAPRQRDPHEAASPTWNIGAEVTPAVVVIRTELERLMVAKEWT